MGRRFDSQMDLKPLTDTELAQLLTDVQAEALRMRMEQRELESKCSEEELKTNDWYRRLIAAKRHMMLLLRRCCIETLKRKDVTFETAFQQVCKDRLPKAEYIKLETEALTVISDVKQVTGNV